MIVKGLIHACSSGGARGQLSILIFHRVLAQADSVLNWDPDAREFGQAMRWIKEWFNVLPLDQAIARLDANTLPPRAAAITFDDGYADNCTVAMPILKSHGLTATFFVATAYLDGGRMWNDTVVHSVRNCVKAKLDLSSKGLGVHDLASVHAVRAAIASILNDIKYRDPPERLELANFVAATAGARLPSDLMLTSEQVRIMRGAGMLIGAHTATHPILARLKPGQVRTEVLDSKDFLESLLQERISLFAYPNGRPNVDYRAVDAEIIRALGFDGAVTTAWGVADRTSDRMQLPRFTPWSRSRCGFGLQLVRNMWQSPSMRTDQTAS